MTILEKALEARSKKVNKVESTKYLKCLWMYMQS